MTQSSTPDYARAKTVGFADIPVIDLAGTDSPAGRATVAAALVKAASEIGFFYVSGHGVSAKLCADAMAASRRFFELPEAAKAGIKVDPHQRGWMAQGLANLEGSATHDAKEVFFWGRDVDADDEQVKAGLPLVHPNQWPDEAAPFLRTGYSSLLPGGDGAGGSAFSNASLSALMRTRPFSPVRMTGRSGGASLSIIRRSARPTSGQKGSARRRIPISACSPSCNRTAWADCRFSTGPATGSRRCPSKTPLSAISVICWNAEPTEGWSQLGTAFSIVQAGSAIRSRCSAIRQAMLSWTRGTSTGMRISRRCLRSRQGPISWARTG